MEIFLQHNTAGADMSDGTMPIGETEIYIEHFKMMSSKLTITRSDLTNTPTI